MGLRIETSKPPDPASQAGSGPLVFLYMGVQNGEAHLQEALDSILSQTYRNLVLVVVDDGSEDRTPKILTAASASDPRVRVVHRAAAGEVAARNVALRLLPKDAAYLMNHDADEVSEPDKIARLVSHMEAHPELDLLGCQVRLVDGSGIERHPVRLPTSPEVIDSSLHEGNALVHSATIYRRRVVERIGGYREAFCGADDYDFLARALQAGFRAANLSDTLHRHRLREQTISRPQATQRGRLGAVIADRLRVTLPWRLAHRQGQPSGLRMHLGCGEQYLDGYVNVDLAAEQHTVQLQQRRDLEENIQDLVLPPGSCREVRSHHVFEHFPRAQALRLLMEWHRWLVEGGTLLLETPDLEHSLKSLLPQQAPALRSKVLRHLFGSQEASWALHLEAYDEARFRHILPALGFEVERVSHAQWQGLANVSVQARKAPIDPAQQHAAASSLLDEAMVDRSPSELRLREVWQEQLGGSALTSPFGG